jgi:predicted nucleotidyltransferase
MTSKLAGLLFNDYRRRVLGLLLLHPEKKYHVREIARLTDTVAGTLHKELARLAEAGVLVKETSGNQVQYSADTKCIVYEELASILRKTTGIVDVIADALEPLAGKINTAFVFGSVARGSETAGSDIDLLIIGEVSFKKIATALYDAQEKLHREINPKVYKKEEWLELVRKKDAFTKEVMAGPKLFIKGSINELG